MNILPMKQEHAAAVAELERLCFAKPWSEEALLEECDNPNAVFLAAVEENEVLGYCGMHTVLDECYMDNVAVSPKHRREGVGRALVTALCACARERHAAFLTLEVRPSNEGAVRLYHSLGFAEVGRRKNFYTAPIEDALLLTKTFESTDRIEENLC